MIRSGGALRPVELGGGARAPRRTGCAAPGKATAAIAGGATSNEEGYLVQRIVRGALGSPHVDSRAGAAPEPRAAGRSSRGPSSPRSVADIDGAESVLVLGADPLHAMPILDLRVRKAVRRHGTRAGDRHRAAHRARRRRRRDRPLRARRRGGVPLGARAASSVRLRRAPTARTRRRRRARSPASLRPGKTVIVWGERLGPGDALAACSTRGRGGRPDGEADRGPGGGQRPRPARGRLRPARPGPAEADAGKDAAGIRDALAEGELSAALLLQRRTPSATSPAARLGRGAQRRAFVVAFSMFEDESTKHADVVFPAEAHAEKEGTVTHPDGRLQRVRPERPAPGDVPARAGRCWSSSPPASATRPASTRRREALAALAAEVPFYAGLTPEEIGGTRRPLAGARGGRERSPRPRTASGTADAQPAASDGARAALCASAPTATSGRPRSPSATRRCASSRPSRRSSCARRRRAPRRRAGRRGRRPLERHEPPRPRRDPRADAARAPRS